MTVQAASGVARPPQARFERAVEVICDRGSAAGAGQFSVGSGFLIGGTKVLTAAHVVEGGEVTVRLAGGATYAARRVPLAAAEGDRLSDEDAAMLAELAAVEVVDPAFTFRPEPLRFGEVDRDGDDPIERCSAVGFPRFRERRAPGQARSLRDTAHLLGVIPPRSGKVSRHLELQVTATPRPLVDPYVSEWSGISGAAVCAYHPGLRFVVVGVIVEHHRPAGSSSLAAVPVSVVAGVGAWRDWLGIEALGGLVAIPAPEVIGPSPYLATVAELARRTPVLLGRQPLLDHLTRFATGRGGPQGYLWLVGHKWTGKTAVVAHFVRNLPADVDAVGYFLTPNGDADSDRFARVANDQLARLVGEGPTAETGNLDAFRSRWARAVERAEARRRHLLLVVDGLDEDTSVRRDLASVASVLPRLTTPWAHVLVTSRAQPTGHLPNLPPDVDPAHPLYEAQLSVMDLPAAEVLHRNRSIEARHRLCPLCKQSDEAEPVPDATAKLGGGVDGQPAAPGTLAAALQLPHTDQSFLVGWAIRATVLAVFLIMAGCGAGAAETTNEFGESTNSGLSSAALVLTLLGFLLAGIPWGIVISRANLRARCRALWLTLHYCHRDRVVFRPETGEWCYPGGFSTFLKRRVASRQQA